MKKIFVTFVCLLLSLSMFAQAPQKMSYQAVLRNSTNALVTNTTVGMRVSILHSSSSGSAVYIETHTPTTNANGLATLEIGTGTIVSGTFASIDWGNGLYFIKTETDPSGGTSYSITGTSQLLSVPYALFSKTAETVTGTINETDPTYTNSPAANITTGDITKLSNLSGTNTGDQDGSETKVTAGTNITITGTGTTGNPYVINGSNTLPTGTAPGQMIYWNGTTWVPVPAGTNGQNLTFCNGMPVWGGCPMLTIVRTGTGTGTVTSNPGALNCGTTCTEYYSPATPVTLTAIANGSSTFTGWSGGGCSGTGTCVVTMNNAATVTANFDIVEYNLSITRTGTGSGAVTSDVGGINCGATCLGTYNSGTTVTLTATPNGSSTFTGWSGGGCVGTGTCVVSMNSAKTVTANFGVNQFNLNVSKSGTGSGGVTSDVGTINCGATCTNAYNAGTTVLLTANPGGTSTFAGWSGACSGTGACSVTMDNSKTVNAIFNTIQYNLNVSKSGTGSGNVSSNVGGLNCGPSCSVSYNSGSTVVLTAVANGTSTFDGWSGGVCVGTGTCVVTMDNVKTVNAVFSPIQYYLTISKTGTGNGTVTSNVGGINCGPTCAVPYNFGTTVTLTATPSGPATFTGWSGACTGTAPCNVTMDNAKNVTANFDN